MNKTILGSIVAVVAVAIIGFVAFAGNKDDMPSPVSDHSAMDMKSSSPSEPAKQESSTQDIGKVTYKGFAVSPKSIKIKKGTTVTWTNEDSAKHDVTPETETAEFKASKLFGKGETYEMTFNTVGTFKYFCSPHPYMKGTIEVVE